MKIPEGVDAGLLIGRVREDHDVVLAGGQKSLSGKIFRIGHMGRTTEDEIEQTIAALANVLPKVGFKATRVPAGG